MLKQLSHPGVPQIWYLIVLDIRHLKFIGSAVLCLESSLSPCLFQFPEANHGLIPTFALLPQLLCHGFIMFSAWHSCFPLRIWFCCDYTEPVWIIQDNLKIFNLERGLLSASGRVKEHIHGCGFRTFGGWLLSLPQQVRQRTRGSSSFALLQLFIQFSF